MKAKRSLFNLVFFILLACLFAYNWYANEVTIKYGNGTYKGEASLGRIVWKGVAHGRGTFTFDSGAKYVGEFKDGKKHGRGIWFDRGDRYIGEYKNDKMNGQGTFTFETGAKYVGEFKDGLTNGQGTFTYDSGSKYVGEFKDGKRHGQGTFTYGIGSMTNKIVHGAKYVGEWMVDQQWNGTLYDPVGNVTATYTDGGRTWKQKVRKKKRLIRPLNSNWSD